MTFTRSSIVAFVTLLAIFGTGVVALPIVISQMEIHLRKAPVPIERDLRTIAVPLGPWVRARDDDGAEVADGIFGAEMLESLGTDQYLDRHYESDGQRLVVHVAYYTGMIDDVPHVPERCWDAAGLDQSMPAQVFEIPVRYEGATIDQSPLNRATGRPYPRIVSTDVIGEEISIHLPVSRNDGVVEMTVTEFQTAPRKDPAARQVGGYFFIANGRIAPGAGDVRMLAFDPQERYAYYCKVQLSYFGRVASGESEDAAVGRFLDIAADLLPRLIPEVMQCLPDWPEMEERSRLEGAA